VPTSSPSTALPARPSTLRGSATYLAAQVVKAAGRVLGDRLAARGLRTHHLAALAALADGGPLCQQDLCARLDLDKSYVVGVVDDLEAAGLARRERDPADRRRHRVAVTDGGRALLAELLDEDARCQDEVLAALTADERRTLVALLGRVVTDLDARRAGAGGGR
jgi:MarR family transcriptional regulator, lower aerobic nicotinate degradation pathway regulator